MTLATILLQIAVVLSTVALLSRLMRPLGQPTVIAEIAAGIALGPSLLGALWPEATAVLFPEAGLPTLGLVAQLGLVFFLFLVGLEFDPRLIAGQWRASVAISNAGIVVPFALGALAALPLHGELAPEGVELLPFSLFLGTSMSVTAFPVLARILTERRLIGTKLGAVALAAAAVDDVTAWCLLALVVGVAHTEGASAALVTSALAIGYSALIWLVVRPVLARVGPRLGRDVSATAIALVFLAMLLSSLATEWIGIHALFGSFLFGAAMPKEAALSRALADKMEDFVTVVFLPLFFAYSGLRTHIGALAGGDWLLFSGLLFVASAGKFGGVALTAKLMGSSLRESTALGLLMNTRGLMELVVLNVGLDLGVISGRLFAMMVLVALATTAITSPLLRYLYPPERVLRESMGNKANADGEGVLLCLSDPGVALPLVTLGRALQRGTEGAIFALHLRRTDRPKDYLRSDIGSEPLTEARRCAEDVGLGLRELSFPSAHPAQDIIHVAKINALPLVLLGAHRDLLGRRTLGKLSEEIYSGAEVDVAVLVGAVVGREGPWRIFARPHGEHALFAALLAERLVRGGMTAVSSESEADLVIVGDLPKALPEGRAYLITRPKGR